MLSRFNRLNLRTSYQATRTTGKKKSSSNFSIYSTPSPHAPKFAVIISKKVAKKSVTRNRIRRLIHTALYLLVKQEKHNTNNLIFVYKDISRLNTIEVKTELETLLKKFYETKQKDSN